MSIDKSFFKVGNTITWTGADTKAYPIVKATDNSVFLEGYTGSLIQYSIDNFIINQNKYIFTEVPLEVKSPGVQESSAEINKPIKTRFELIDDY